MKKRQSGFSAIEIMIVLAIGMILMAMVTPLVTTALNMYRLRGACRDYSNLVQMARMRAVTDDTYYNVVNVVGFPPAGAMNAFINTGTTATGGPVAAQTYVVGDPGTAFNPAVVVQPPGGAPNTVNLYNQFLPGIAQGAVAINPNAWGPTFGPRGLPCQPTAATGGSCSYTSGGLPIAFETFTQNVLTGIWEAVTINPSGRVREWHYEVATNNWRPLD